MVEDGHHMDDLRQGLLEAVDEDRAGDRGAAELEEVLVDPDLALRRQPQDLVELMGEEALQRGSGRHAGLRGRGAGGLRRGQRPAVDLAVRGQRQRVQEDEGRGHHVVRQPLGQAPGAGRRRSVDVPPPRRPPGGARPVLARQDHGLADARLRGQRGLDLAQLDAEAADLDLVVDAAEVLELAVRQAAGEVAGAVEARAWSRRRTGRGRSARR